jgi:putative hydrolase of the HAD superfamily
MWRELYGVRPIHAHINTWLFDLDLTLYPPDAEIMQQIRDRIALFVQNHFKIDTVEANVIRERFYKRYGTTLGGLMAEHSVDPHSYLDFVHDVDMSRLKPCSRTRFAIETLPGRKIIFTNADAPYAERVLQALDLTGVFETIYDIHRMQHRPKPEPVSYTKICKDLAIDPASALFVEDSPHNLPPAKAIGMTTIWMNHGEHAASDADRNQIDHEIHNLADWLATVTQ